MKLERPICSIDVESTGTDPAKDRIIQLGFIRIEEGKPNVAHKQLFDPGMPIPPSSTFIHGITDDKVKGMPTFASCAKRILTEIGGCDLIGFNIHNFDLPILWEEFYRAGITWIIDFNVIDVGTIFKKMQPRTLAAAYREYCGLGLADAHDALADAIATYEVLKGQREAHAEIGAMTVSEAAQFSKFDNRIDLAGKLVLIDGVPCYGFGKHKGMPVAKEPRYGYWMLDKDFSANTKMHLESILASLRPVTAPDYPF